MFSKIDFLKELKNEIDLTAEKLLLNNSKTKDLIQQHRKDLLDKIKTIEQAFYSVLRDNITCPINPDYFFHGFLTINKVFYRDLNCVGCLDIIFINQILSSQVQIPINEKVEQVYCKKFSNYILICECELRNITLKFFDFDFVLKREHQKKFIFNVSIVEWVEFCGGEHFIILLGELELEIYKISLEDDGFLKCYSECRLFKKYNFFSSTAGHIYFVNDLDYKLNVFSITECKIYGGKHINIDFITTRSNFKIFDKNVFFYQNHFLFFKKNKLDIYDNKLNKHVVSIDIKFELGSVHEQMGNFFCSSVGCNEILSSFNLDNNFKIYNLKRYNNKEIYYFDKFSNGNVCIYKKPDSEDSEYAEYFFFDFNFNFLTKSFLNSILFIDGYENKFVTFKLFNKFILLNKTW